MGGRTRDGQKAADFGNWRARRPKTRRLAWLFAGLGREARRRGAGPALRRGVEGPHTCHRLAQNSINYNKYV